MQIIVNNKKQDNAQNENKGKLAKIRLAFFIWNIISMAIYTAYTLFSLYNKSNESKILSKLIVILLIAYAIAFVLLIVFGLTNQKRLKNQLKDYKSSVKVLKLFVKLINLALSIITAVNIFMTGGHLQLFDIIFAVLTLNITFISILFEIFKIFMRRFFAKKKEKHRLIKEEKLKEQQQSDDLVNIN